MAGASSDEDGMVTGINITPLVDVMLVLLVIMMVTAKIIVSNSLPLDLPQAAKGEEVQMVFGVELFANGNLQVDGEPIKEDKMVMALAQDALKKDKTLRAVIRADKTVQHGRIITILDLLKQAGVAKIAFGVTPIAAEPGAVRPKVQPPAPAPPPAEDGKK